MFEEDTPTDHSDTRNEQPAGGSPRPPLITDHELIRRIGSGSYGEVWLARNIMGTYRAVKLVYRQTFSEERSYEREFRGMEKFEPVSRSHEGLVDILQVGSNAASGYYYYVMELGDDGVSGQDIDPDRYEAKTLGKEVSKRGRLSFEECLQIALPLTAALGHLHKNGLIHRDLKPSNIIFVNGIPKIADIGLVANLGSAASFVGTPGFIPPEGPGTAQADIYSLGKVLYEISTGKDRQDFPALHTQLGEPEGYKELVELNEVILKACETDIRKRYFAAEEMYADLLLLKAGKSVKRLRLLEERLAILKKIILVIGAFLIIGAGAYYQARIAKKRAIQQLAASYVATGTRSVDENDLFGSLPWFAEAVRLQEGNKEDEGRHRLHLGVVLRQCPKLVRVWARDETVNDAEFSPDGRRVVTSGDDRLAVIWDVGKDRRSLELVGHLAAVQAASFNQDGHLVVTASWDKTARVWDADTGRQVASLTHPETVYSAEFDRTGSRVVTGCGDGKARVWDWRINRTLAEFTNHTAAVRHAALSPDGSRLVTASADNTALITDVVTKQVVGRPLRHEGPDGWVYDASFSPDGRYVATASFDKTARILDTESGLMRTLDHKQAVRSVQFSPDGRFVVAACWDYTARVWDVRTGKAVSPPLKHSSYVMHAAFAPDGRRIVTATTQGIISLWDLASDHWLPPSIFGHFSQDGTRYAAVEHNRLRVSDSATLKIVSELPLATTNGINIVLNRDGSRLAIVSTASGSEPAHQAQVWDAVRGKPLSQPFRFGSPIKNAALSADGRRMILLAGRNSEVWDVLAGARLFSLEHADEVTKLALSPDAERMATVSGANVYLWNLLNGKLDWVLWHGQKVSHAEFSPDGSLLLSATLPPALAEGEARIWEVKSGRPLGSPLRHNDGVRHASFSPNGRFLVTASEDKTAQVWLTATGRRRGPPLVHKDEVSHAVFSGDNRQIVTACRDATMRVWDVDSGEPLTPPLKHQWGSVAGAQFIARGLSILTRRLTDEAKVWVLSQDTRPIEDLLQTAWLLSGSKSDEAGGALPLTKETLLSAWRTLHAKYPAAFTASIDEIVSWHRREAEDSERAGEWRVAVFHWTKLTELSPAEPAFREHRAACLKRLDPSQTIPVR